MKPDRLYLLHILECISRVRDVMSAGRDEFVRSHMRQDAVLRNLQTLAESTQRVSPDAKTRHAEIDWRRIAAFRNVLVHDYLGVDIERILDIVERDLPDLERIVQRMLSEFS